MFVDGNQFKIGQRTGFFAFNRGADIQFVRAAGIIQHFIGAVDDHQVDVAAHPLAGALSAHRTLGTLQRHAALLDQVVDLLEVLHVLRRKEPVALLVALGPQDGELRLPVAEQRLIDVEHLGHLAHRIV